MFERLGRSVFAHRRIVLIVGLVVLVAAGLWGGSVSKRLSSGGYYDPHSESVKASNAMKTKLGLPSVDVTVLLTSQTPVTDAATAAAIQRALAAVPRDVVPAYSSYWTTRQPAFLSPDAHSTYVTMQLAGTGDAAQVRSLGLVKQILVDAKLPGITADYGGLVPLNNEISGQVSKDLKRAETLSLPIVLLLLLIIFGSLASASLPLAVGICGIVSAFAVLRVLTVFVDVSIFAQNLVTMLGLGLAVDYALFMVSRFREELGRQPDVRGAVLRTMATAGRTVAFSGVTIAVSAASLTLFPESFLRSMGYGGVAVVLIDVLASLTVLPALLAVLGHRVDALRIPTPWRRIQTADASSAPADLQHGFWYRLAHSVMRRPLLYAVPIVAVLALMAAPFLNVTFGGYTAKVLPATAHGRVITDTLARDFPGNATQPIQVVVEGVTSPAGLVRYVGELRSTAGVTRASVIAVKGDNALVQVGFNGDSISGEARSTLANVRAVPIPPGSQVLVGGATAFLVDQLHSIGHVLPWMLVVMVVAMFVLLFLAFGSFVLPIKAIIMNTLSIGASFGAITWIFQSGHLAHWLGFSKLGYLDATDPILMLAVVFGLSMDYEVFLLSRIREEWDSLGRTGARPSDLGLTEDRNATSVAVGLQRSGRIITSAALLLVIVIGSFAMSKVATLKLLGLGMALAIAVDATIVRAMLVPAVMRLLGTSNWWAPGPFARWWDAHGLHEADDVQPAFDGAPPQPSRRRRPAAAVPPPFL
ncbi:MAG: putative drug exporter of the superfamily [Actinomycetota bacterium]|nr:putative drug exporter of the superfamily [Actinomycetota bacterium]